MCDQQEQRPSTPVPGVSPGNGISGSVNADQLLEKLEEGGEQQLELLSPGALEQDAQEESAPGAPITPPLAAEAAPGWLKRVVSAAQLKYSTMQENTKFIIFAGGIFICYFYYGLMQEKITRGKYGEAEDRFTSTLSLVLVQNIFNYIFAKIMLSVQPPKEPDNTKVIYYFCSASTYLFGMVASNMALQWVNYPTQVIGKSAKPIPVMILGVMFGHKKYPLKRYFFVFTIVIGVAAFMYKEQKQQAVQQSSGFGIGELLLVLSLFMDGLTGAVQDRMKAETAPSAKQMMLKTNYFSSIILSIGVVATGEILTFSNFVAQHPVVLWYLLSLAIAGGLGQLCIFLTISHFGPLVCSVITTTRKFFTVLGSVIIFGNTLLPTQWVGAVMVFTGLFLDIFYGKDKKAPQTTRL